MTLINNPRFLNTLVQAIMGRTRMQPRPTEGDILEIAPEELFRTLSYLAEQTAQEVAGQAHTSHHDQHGEGGWEDQVPSANLSQKVMDQLFLEEEVIGLYEEYTSEHDA